MSRHVVEIAGRRLALSNLEKTFYPASGFTKAEVLDYYRRIAAWMLPHLQDRAVTLKRYPEGVTGPFFFEKRCPSHHPDWVDTAEVHHREETLTACLVNELATLLWAANLAAIELHCPLARAISPEAPDALVFDLDPGEPADVFSCARVALILRELLARLDLTGLVKTSGRKGLHVFVPLNRPDTSFEATKTFSRTVALILQKNYPELVTAKMAKEERRGRVFINWSQNDAAKTMICAYSLRGEEQPTVSCPLAWTELEQLAQGEDPERLRFGPGEVVHRAEHSGDLFGEVLRREQRLPHL